MKKVSIFQILKESTSVFFETFFGFMVLRKFSKYAVILGAHTQTLATPENSSIDFYEDSKAIGAGLASRDFTVLTGGGPGIMKNANEGAFMSSKKGHGHSVSITIPIASEQQKNKYFEDTFNVDSFRSRKYLLRVYSEVFIFMPGGFGTLDELFMLLTITATGKIEKPIIILYGKKFWAPLIDFMKNQLLEKHGAIEKSSLNLFVVLNDPDEVIYYIEKNYNENSFDKNITKSINA